MKTGRRQLLIFDFDGCLYPYPADCMDTFNKARAGAGVEISRGTLDPQTASERGRKDFLEHGISYINLCREFGLSLAEGNMIQHRHTVFALQRDEALIDALKGLDRGHVTAMILTQSSRCNLDRHLPQIGIEHAIPRNLRVTVDDYGYGRLKEHSEYPWLYAKWRAQHMTGTQFADTDITVFEDSPKNLLYPHALGWNTVFTHHGAPINDLPAHIHRQTGDLSAMLAEFPQRPPPQGANELTR